MTSRGFLTPDPSNRDSPPQGLRPHYDVVGLIGAGGMGRVYRARDVRHGREVAIKVLASEPAALLGRERFLREIAITAQLNHPHIVPVFDSGEVDGQLYYVMPYITGETLRQRLTREPMLPLPQVLTWAEEIADGLDAAHANGVIHRDIKPENLLIQDGHILIADFGLARTVDLAAGDRLTTQNLVVGTLPYMSPEQATGTQTIDGRSDVFSMACVVHEMLTGSPPFSGANPQAITALKMAEHYPRVRTIRPSLPTAIDAALAEALRAQPADRLVSGSALVVKLKERGPRRFHAARWAMAAGLLALLLAGLAWLQRPGTAVTPADTPRRVMVDIFTNRTGDPSHGALGIMAEDWLIEGLQRTSVVEVVPTVTAMAAARFVADQNKSGDPVRSLAAETGAQLIVTGSIYRDRDSLIIQAQLVDAAAGKVIGAIEPVHMRDGVAGPALRVLRDRVMSLLALRLDDRAIAGDRPPMYHAYLAFSLGLDAYTRNEYDSALIAFRRAYQADTGFALPLMYASICLSNLGDFAGADSLIRVLSRHSDALTIPDKYWLDHRIAELSGNDAASLEALRRAALLAPGTKAGYNFAVQAYEARLPFPAESALRELPPDKGAMRGWFPYWDVLTSALHAEQKHRDELTAAREARQRFPDRIESLALLARALAALGKSNDLEALWTAAQPVPDRHDLRLAAIAYDVGSELVAHADSVVSDQWFERARQLAAPAPNQPNATEGQLLLARSLWRLRRLQEAYRQIDLIQPAGPFRARVLGLRGVLSAEIGDRGEAERVLGVLSADSEPYTYGRSQYEAARIAVALGASQRAAGLLELALNRGLPFDDDFHRDRLLFQLRTTSVYGRLSPGS